MPGTYSKLLYHIVFSTKQRGAWLKPDIAPRIHEYLGGIVRGEGGAAHLINGMPDHVHLLISWRTDESIATLMRNLKAHSSRWVHQTFPDMVGFRWQEGYSVFTVSESQFDPVQRYIQNQEDHHRGRPFEEEMRSLLRAHRIEFDERYVFD
ncbi:MAG: IS200/IS605 family transposase [Planctomycetota bacterium]